jgi:PEP-CTERM motif
MTSKKNPYVRKFLLAFPLIALLLSVNGQAGTVPPIWETNVGGAVAFSDINGPNADDGTVVINFGFAFPFLGNTYTSGRLSSNGFLWLNPANTDAQFDGNVSAFLAGDPRIAGGWNDLNSGAAGSVNFNTFGGNRAVITFQDVPEFSTTTPYTFQMQLLSTGRIVFGYNLFPTPAQFDNILIGVTPGNNPADPGSSDLLNGTPFISSGGTVYQFIASAGIGPLALSTFEGSNVIFDPNGSGFNVTTQTAAAATPEPGTFGMLGLGTVALLGIARRRLGPR